MMIDSNITLTMVCSCVFVLLSVVCTFIYTKQTEYRRAESSQDSFSRISIFMKISLYYYILIASYVLQTAFFYIEFFVIDYDKVGIDRYPPSYYIVGILYTSCQPALFSLILICFTHLYSYLMSVTAAVKLNRYTNIIAALLSGGSIASYIILAIHYWDEPLLDIVSSPYFIIYSNDITSAVTSVQAILILVLIAGCTRARRRSDQLGLLPRGTKRLTILALMLLLFQLLYVLVSVFMTQNLDIDEDEIVRISALVNSIGCLFFSLLFVDPSARQLGSPQHLIPLLDDDDDDIDVWN
eukprot:gnl/Dysnectes_brevis/2179_a2538_1006.p1 GENE.gnl/Dysnectes_brevis/2179_a2538_1006~~gnl/Dysnectes_brevis/2179_a2538_1006.p1  ORF type:complete len:297 (-),score=74.09 gnl/Dysnectes_brevis/2179_a2538_1006:72-962(-)